MLVTGHTGFKGTWLCHWLQSLGANVVGYALAPNTDPSHHAVLREKLGVKLTDDRIADIRDLDAMTACVAEHKPDIVFHMAAQPLVRYSYDEPVETMTTNVIGTLHVYEACRAANVRAIVSITTDKVYENAESPVGYKEDARLGGYDPYSASKACAELLSASYRNSYFPLSKYGDTHHTLLATARAGNVIGGGDWSLDRLIPDAIRGAAAGEPMTMRNPAAVRPWQHVLEPLSGYLMLGERLLQGDASFAEAWNFGPGEQGEVDVHTLVTKITQVWDKVQFNCLPKPEGPHETNQLRLNTDKAQQRLGWVPVWTWERAVEHTIDWYRAFYEDDRCATENDLKQYVSDSAAASCQWVAA